MFNDRNLQTDINYEELIKMQANEVYSQKQEEMPKVKAKTKPYQLGNQPQTRFVVKRIRN